MKPTKKSLGVPVIIVCTLGWSYFASQAIQIMEKEKPEAIIKTIEEMEQLSVPSKLDAGYKSIQDQYYKLVMIEEQKVRLAKLEEERRIIRIEKERLAKIKAKKEAERKAKIEAEKKRQVSRGEVTVDSSKSGWLTFNTSYYGADCNGCSGKTAAGVNVTNTQYHKGYRVIAADPRILPMGTLVEIVTPYETIKGIVADTGGAIKGYKLDVLVSSEARASQIGRHNAKLRIIGKIDI